MTVKELKEFLSQYDDEVDVFIDKSVDGGWSDIRYLTESDITKYGDTKIIIGYLY